MKNKLFTVLIIGVIGFVAFVLGAVYLNEQRADEQRLVSGRMVKHQIDVSALNQRLTIEKEAYKREKNGEYDEAIKLFRKAVNVVGENAASTPARLSLARIYETIGDFEKAIKEIEWFLNQDQTEQGRAETISTIDRLKKKMARN